MAILVANIGTSDLAIKVEDGKYAEKYQNLFLSMGLNISEPNLVNDSNFNNKQLFIDTKNFPREYASEKFGIEKYTFREFTEILWQKYEKEPNNWQQKIYPGRICSVIEKAIEFDVKSIYIFITDQPEQEPNDTIFLFKILKKWFESKWQSQGKKGITIESILVPKDILAIDQNKLLEFYYDFFKKVDRNEDLFISIKGGTYQMQTALRVQAMSSDNRLLFLDPQLSVQQVLDGKISNCIVTSYWRYLKTQKYQTVKLLLKERWDFHGAKVILEEWQNTLSFLQKYLQQEAPIELDREKNKLDSVIKNLENAVDYLNFASDIIHRDNLHSILNLYTQCRIYWKLEEIANFLPRLGSFYEEVIHAIIIEMKGEQYCKHGNRHQKWTLLKSRLDPSLIKSYEEAEKKFIWDEKLWRKKTAPKTKNDKSEKIIGYEFIFHDEHRLTGSRYRKKSFAEALINHAQDKSLVFYWQKIDKSLNRINYWVDQRNDLIHGVKGLSKNSMKEKKIYDIEEYDRSSLKYKENPYISDPNKSCKSDDIIREMSIICHNLIKLFGKEKSPYVDVKNTEQATYYLYSAIREQVIKQLDE